MNCTGLQDTALSAVLYPSPEKASAKRLRQDFSERTVLFTDDLKRTGVTRLLLWEEYKTKFPLGYEYSQFCELLSGEQKLGNAFMHFEYIPATCC